MVGSHPLWPCLFSDCCWDSSLLTEPIIAFLAHMPVLTGRNTARFTWCRGSSFRSSGIIGNSISFTKDYPSLNKFASTMQSTCRFTGIYTNDTKFRCCQSCRVGGIHIENTSPLGITLYISTFGTSLLHTCIPNETWVFLSTLGSHHAYIWIWGIFDKIIFFGKKANFSYSHSAL